MIFKVYSYFNKKVGAYNPPVFSPFDKEIKVEQDQRAFILCKDEDKETMKELDLYFVGTFDDKLCVFDLEAKPEWLCSFQEVKSDVKEE